MVCLHRGSARKPARFDEFLLRSDQQHFPSPDIVGVGQHAEARRPPCQRLGEAVRSYAPGTVRRSDRLRRLRQPETAGCAGDIGRLSSEATRSTASSGVPSLASEVTRTTRGPSARNARIAASASPRSVVAAELSSSNWLGVTMSATGTACSDEFENATPHEHPSSGVADHRVATVTRRRVGALDPRPTASRTASPVSADGQVAGNDAVTLAQHATLLDTLRPPREPRPR